MGNDMGVVNENIIKQVRTEENELFGHIIIYENLLTGEEYFQIKLI